MKFLVKSVINIVIFMVILIIPVTLFVTFFALGNIDLPLWNIGVRNVLIYARKFLVPSILVSYLLATLLVVARVDKMRVKSIFLLHLPAVIAACIIGAGLFMLQNRQSLQDPFKLAGEDMDLAPHRFFNSDVFTQAGSRQIRVKWQGREAVGIYYYDSEVSRPVTITNIKTGQNGTNQLYVDEQERVVVLKSGNLPGHTVRIPYSDFLRRKNTTDLQIFRGYEKQIREIYRWLRERGSLTGPHLYILFGALLLTFLMISIPLVYAMNDTGWGFSGIIGIFLVLAILPFFYNFMIKAVNRFITLTSFLGMYAYLFPAIVFGLCGLLLDVIIKSQSRARG